MLSGQYIRLFTQTAQYKDFLLGKSMNLGLIVFEFCHKSFSVSEDDSLSACVKDELGLVAFLITGK